MARHPGRGGHAWRNLCKQVYATSNVCIICGHPIDYTLPYPHPFSKSVDHRIPISRLRHLTPAEQRSYALNPANVGPAHLRCNESRGNRVTAKRQAAQHSRSW